MEGKIATVGKNRVWTGASGGRKPILFQIRTLPGIELYRNSIRTIMSVRKTSTSKIFHAKPRFLTSKNAKKEKEENSGSKQGDGFLCGLALRDHWLLIFQMGRGKGYSALAFSKCSTMLCFY